MDVWYVPEKFICTHMQTAEESPCYQDNEVVCWVARPKEKTIILIYMVVVFMVSTSLTLIEVVYVTIKWSCRFHQDFDDRPPITQAFTKQRMKFDSEYQRYYEIRHEVKMSQRSTVSNNRDSSNGNLLQPTAPSMNGSLKSGKKRKQINSKVSVSKLIK